MSSEKDQMSASPFVLVVRPYSRKLIDFFNLCPILESKKHKLKDELKSRPCENCLADFSLLHVNGQAFRSAEVRKSAREFLHGLDLRPSTSWTS